MEKMWYLTKMMVLCCIRSDVITGGWSKEMEEGWVDVYFKMWESCKIEKKECFPEREAEQECNKEEVDSKMEGGENFNQINGISSTENIDDGGSPPSKQQQHKKKKPMHCSEILDAYSRRRALAAIGREIDQFGLTSAILAGRYIWYYCT